MSESTVAGRRQRASGDGFRIVQHTLMVPDQEFDVRPLYLSGGAGFAGGSDDQSGSDSKTESESGQESTVYEADRGLTGYGRVTDEGFAVVDPERRLTLRDVLQRLPGQLLASLDRRAHRPADGARHAARARSSSTGRPRRGMSCAPRRTTSRATTCRCWSSSSPSTPFIDGGWYWFDLEAGDAELMLEEAVWGVETDRTGSGRVTIGITTFNRPDFCVDQLLNLGARPPGPRHHRRGAGDRPGHPAGAPTTRCSTRRPRRSAPSCASSSSPTWAAPAASPAP